MSNTAKSPSLYRAVTRLAEKAEKLDGSIVTAAFVDIGHITRIMSFTNSYIEGRRGTGKTHLLMYLAERANERLAIDRTVAVYLDLRELRAESGPDETDPPTIARKIFRHLLLAIASTLRDISSRHLWQNSVPTERSPYDLRVAQRTREALGKLEAAAHGSPFEVSPSKRTEKSSVSTKTEDSTSLSVGADSAQKVPLLGSLMKRLHGETKKETLVEDTRQFERRVVPSEIRAAIEEFLDANELLHLYICVDEWSSVPLAAQPLLAESLKRCLFVSRNISVKIAILPFLAKFSAQSDAGQRVGFERSGDIFAGLDLDNELVFARHRARSQEMLSDLLFKHLKYSIEQYAPDTSELSFYESPNKLVESLFTSAAFRRLPDVNYIHPSTTITSPHRPDAWRLLCRTA